MCYISHLFAVCIVFVLQDCFFLASVITNPLFRAQVDAATAACRVTRVGGSLAALREQIIETQDLVVAPRR